MRRIWARKAVVAQLRPNLNPLKGEEKIVLCFREMSNIVFDTYKVPEELREKIQRIIWRDEMWKRRDAWNKVHKQLRGYYALSLGTRRTDVAGDAS